MASPGTLESDMARMESQLDLFEDSIDVIVRSLRCSLEPNPYYPELQATYERLLQNEKENEAYELEKQKEIVTDLQQKMEEMKKLLLELELENQKLKEKDEKQRKGKELLQDLMELGKCDEILEAANEMMDAYAKCERYLDIEREKGVIRDVERLKKIMTTGMTKRDCSAGVSLFSGLATILLRSHPVGRVITGAISAVSLAFYLSYRKNIEITWMRIENALKADAERFALLVTALEDFDQILQRNFGFGIHSEKFREVCTVLSEAENDVTTNSLEKGFKDPLSLFPDKKLQATFQWFNKNKVWKNIKSITSSHYLYSTINTIALFCDNPALQICVPGFSVVCQMFLVVQDYSSDKSKLSAVNQGLKRMQDELNLMKKFKSSLSTLEEDE